MDSAKLLDTTVHRVTSTYQTIFHLTFPWIRGTISKG
jgi:hypothetical protein